MPHPRAGASATSRADAPAVPYHPDTLRKHRRNARGLCARCDQPPAPGRMYCTDHLQAMRDWHAGRPWIADTLIAHCRQWWPITALPWSCSLCGWTLRQEDL